MQLIKRELAAAEMEAAFERIRVLTAGNAVVVFAVNGCCMCHVVKRLLHGLGVGPTLVELDEGGVPGGDSMLALLGLLSGGRAAAVPAVFVGGRFLGGVEAVMTWHINGTLVPLLKEVGALWL